MRESILLAEFAVMFATESSHERNPYRHTKELIPVSGVLRNKTDHPCSFNPQEKNRKTLVQFLWLQIVFLYGLCITLMRSYAGTESSKSLVRVMKYSLTSGG